MNKFINIRLFMQHLFDDQVTANKAAESCYWSFGSSRNGRFRPLSGRRLSPLL